MAVAVEEIREKVAELKASTERARQQAHGPSEQVGLWLVVLVVMLLAIILKTLPEDDPVLRRLEQAPQDDEALDAEEEAVVAQARQEPSIPWEEAKRRLIQPDA